MPAEDVVKGLLALVLIGFMAYFYFSPEGQKFMKDQEVKTAVFQKSCKEKGGTPKDYRGHPRVCVLYEEDY